MFRFCTLVLFTLTIAVSAAETVISNQTITGSSVLVGDSLRTQNVVIASGASVQEYGFQRVVWDAGTVIQQGALVVVRMVSGSPSMSSPGDAQIPEDGSTGTRSFTVSHAQIPPEGIMVTVATSNPGLLPVSRISLGGAGPSRTVMATPVPNGNGTAVVTLTATSGALSSSVSFTVTVQPVDDPPVAMSKSVTTNEDVAVGITLSATDFDSSALTYRVISGPTRGTLSGTPPSLSYKGNQDVNGTDSFTYVANDGQVDSQVATVSITITAVNDAPVAAARSLTVAEDAPATAITLTATDVDSTVLTYRVTTPPTKGILSGTAPALTYKPNADANGADSFQYVANDGQLDSLPALVSITITPVNDAPVAAAKSATTNEDTPVAITLSGSDVDGNPLTYRVTVPPTKGVLSGTPPSLTYTANQDVNGTDSFAYVANDGTVDSTAPATVSITITAVNDAPVVAVAPKATPAPVTGTTSVFSVLGTDVDDAESTLTYTWASSTTPAPTFGTNGSNAAKSSTVTFTKAGTYACTVNIRDPAGATLPAPVAFSVTVAQTPQPVAVTPTTATVTAGSQLTFTAVQKDQFGTVLTPAPTFTSATGGTITPAGVYTAGTGTVAGTYQVTATGNGLSTSVPVIVRTVPVVATTSPLTGITSVAATGGGTVTSDGGAAVSSRGLCWSTTANPTIANATVASGSGTGTFPGNLSGLLGSTTYHVRAYATNPVGTGYGADVTVTTSAPVVPTVTVTAAASAITSVGATSGGTITSDGGAAVTARGSCWATTANPTTANPKTTDGIGIGTFPSGLSGLIGSTLYHVRAYATTSAGTAYGPDVTFTTGAPVPPTLTTTPASGITAGEATSGGTITSDGGAAVTTRGVCWSTTANPTIADSKVTSGSGVGTFTGGLTNLLGNTTYHIRAYAANSAGTSYGNDVTFTTSAPVAPTVVTTAITAITTAAAKSGGTLSSQGGSPVLAKGICWSTSANPDLTKATTLNGSGPGNFTSDLSGLASGRVYHVRAYATNAIGTGYGADIACTTTAVSPAQGGTSGGTVVTITGVNLAGVTAISFGGIAGTAITGNTATSVTVTAPAHAGGQADIVVTATAGTVTLPRAFTYVTPQPLDGTSAVAAYGLRRLRAAYTGPLVQIRRSSDNTVAAWLPDATGWLSLTSQSSDALADAPTLGTWIGTANGFVATWYDQTATATHATQTTVANQPQLLTTGQLSSQSGKAALSFNGTQRLQIPRVIDTDWTVTATVATTQVLTGTSWWGDAGLLGGDVAGPLEDFGILFSNGRPGVGTGASEVRVVGTTPVNTGKPTTVSWTRVSSTGAVALFTNGAATGTGTVATGAKTASTQLSIGSMAGTGAGTSFSGQLTELVIANTVLPTASRQAIEASQGSAFGSFPATPGLVLDAIGNAAASYSLRRVSTSANGPLVRIRRSTDSSLASWKADATGWLSLSSTSPDGLTGTPTLGTWIGTADGFVAAWYDQSGQGNHALQATAANQPQLLTAGALVTVNGKPTVSFNGSNQRLQIPRAIDTDWTVTVTATTTQALGGAAWWNDVGIVGGDVSGPLGDFGLLYSNGFPGAAAGPTEARLLSSVAANSGVPTIVTWSRTSSSGALTILINGAQTASGTLSAGPKTASSQLSIGSVASAGGGPSFNGRISELTLYRSVLPTASRQTVEQSQGAGFLLPPTVTTTAATAITATGATTGGNITAAGDTPVTARGVCWATTANPTTANSTLVSGTGGIGVFTSNLIGLTTGTTYHVRAYATSAAGTAYGADLSVTTTMPVITTILAQAPVSVLQKSGSTTCTATAKDQFGTLITPSPAFTWSVTGVGSINATTGIYAAGITPGTATITAAAGGKTASTTIRVNAPPTVATKAAATPSPVTGATAILSVLGADDAGEPTLTYAWSTTGAVPAAVRYSSQNGTNAGKQAAVTFAKAGNYTFQVTIQDGQGSTVADAVSVTVNQTLSALTVTSALTAISPSGTVSLSAAAQDQFGMPMTTPPVLGWAVSGGGTISSAGVFTAGQTPAFVTVTASSGNVKGTASVRINAPPTIAIQAAASPSPATGNATILTVLGADDDVEANLSYTWSAVGTPPGTVAYGANGMNAAKRMPVTLAALGDYTFQVVVKDLQGASATSTVKVTSVRIPGVPSVIWTSPIPTADVAYATPTTVTFKAQIVWPTAAGQVDVLANGKIIGSASGNPAQFTWNAIPSGYSQILMQATTPEGVVGRSIPITVVIGGTIANQVPRVVIGGIDINPADLTGDRSVVIQGQRWLVTRNHHVNVCLSATTDSGTFTDGTLSVGGQVVQVPTGGTGGVIGVPVDVADGSYEIRVSLTAQNGTGSSSAGLAGDPCRLIVCSTPPVLTQCLGGDGSNEAPYPLPPYTPLLSDLPPSPQLAIDDLKRIFLNANPETGSFGNSHLRATRGTPFFSCGSFVGTVVFASPVGLAKTAGSQRAAFISGSTTTSLQVATRRDGADLPNLLDCRGWGSISDGDGSAVCTAVDACGNQTSVNVQAFRALVQRSKPGFGPTRIGADRPYASAVSPARYISLSPFVSFRQQGRLALAYDSGRFEFPSPIVLKTTFALKGYLQPHVFPELEPTWADGVVQTLSAQDVAGNYSDYQPVDPRDTQLSLTWASPVTTQSPEVMSIGTGPYGGMCYDYPWDWMGMLTEYDATAEAWWYAAINYSFAPIPGFAIVYDSDPNFVQDAISSNGLGDQSRYGGLIPYVSSASVPDYMVDEFSPYSVGLRPIVPRTVDSPTYGRLVVPVVQTLAPSWTPAGTEVLQPLSIRDPGLANAVAVSDHPATAPADVICPVGTDLALDATMDLATGYLNAQIDVNPNSWSKLQRGFLPLSYLWEGASLAWPTAVGTDPYGNPINDVRDSAAGYGTTLPKVLNVIQAVPDILTNGSAATLRLKAGFIDATMDWETFNKSGDYVHFLASGGSDLTIPVSTTTVDPAMAASKIRIRGQRLIPWPDNPTLCQTLELDLDVGVLVPSGLYHIDVKLGAVKAYTDDLSRQYAGANGSHRMKQSLKILGAVMAVDGNRDGSLTFDAVDTVTQQRPWRWWINDDKDVIGKDIDPKADIPGSGSNYNSATVNGRRDLVDWFPIAIDIGKLRQAFPGTAGYTLGFKQSDSAVAIVASDIGMPGAFGYLTVIQETGYGTALSQPPYNAAVNRVGSQFTPFPAELEQRLEGSASSAVILAEGVHSSTAPLQLIARKGGVDLVVATLPLSFSPIEQMYRWVNLRNAVGLSELRSTDLTEPKNRPDNETNGKQVVWVHGFNVGEPAGRAWGAEMFKRLYQTRSKAMYTAVHWAGEQQTTLTGQVFGIADYHLAEQRAFASSQQFAADIALLPSGPKVLISHSAGAMVVGGAIVDWGLQDYVQHICIDSAVGQEAYYASLPVNYNMVPPTWVDAASNDAPGQTRYPDRLWSANWYKLWPASDHRSELTWRGRLSISKLPRLFNMYSTGEEVLKNVNGDTITFPSFGGGTSGTYSWGVQEWVKGEKTDIDFNDWFLDLTISGIATFIGNNIFGHELHGGWGFNRKHAISTDPNEEDPSFARFYRQSSVRECWFPLGLSGADIFNRYGGQYSFPIGDRVAEALGDLGDARLRVEPFFLKFNSVGIFGSTGSEVAAQQKTLLLAQALPVTTYAMGSNPLNDGGIEVVPGFDMNANRPNNWPTGEGWHHSDIKDVAYLYTWAAFDKLANQGGLR